jgi:hypothetical protein
MDSTQGKLLRLNKVPLGISLVFYGLELTALAIILMFAVPFVVAGNLALLIQVVFGLSILLVGASILSFVGKALCLTAPSDMQGKTAIYTAVVLDVLGIVIQLASQFTTVPKMVADSSNLLAIAAFVCFLLFLQQLGRYLHDDELTSKSAGLLKLGIALVVSLVLSLASAFVMPPAIIVFGFVALILGVLGLIRYARLLLGFKKKLSPS